MLENYAFPQFEQIEQESNLKIVFQQDGAPPHFALRVRERLNEKFPGQWIGRGGPILWPPRSPDLSPLDFFLWGYVKDTVYKTPVKDIQELKTRITAAIDSVTHDMLANVWRGVSDRLDLCRARNGGHVECV